MKTLAILLPLLLTGSNDERTLVIYEVSDVVQASLEPAGRADHAVTKGLTVMSSEGKKTVFYEVNGKQQLLAEETTTPEPAPLDPELLEKREAETERLAALVREWADPPIGSKETVRAIGDGTLVVLAREGQHAWIRTFLEKQRASRVLFDIEAGYIEAPSGGFAKVGYPEPSAVLKDLDALRVLNDQLAATAGFSVEKGPRLVSPNNSYSGQATVAGLSYVKAWRLVTVHPGKRKIADPVVEAIWVGDGLEGVAFELPSGNYGVELHYSREGVVEPIPTALVPLGDSGEEAEVAMPEATKFDMEARFELPPGGAALFWAPKPEGSGEIGVLIAFRTRT